MGDLTRTTPKPLVSVLGRPAIYWVLDGLIAAGLSEVVVVTGYLADQVAAALHGYRAGELHLTFVHQEEQQGTAHALRLTRQAVTDSSILLAFADIMTSPANFSALVRRFHEEQCDLTAAVRNAGDPWRAAAVYVDPDWNIKAIIEKPPPGTSTTPWSHAGIYCFSNAIYEYAARVKPSTRGEYEVTDAVQMMIAENRRCQAVELTGYWKDLATPEDILAAEVMMRETGEPQFG